MDEEDEDEAQLPNGDDPKPDDDDDEDEDDDEEARSILDVLLELPDGCRALCRSEETPEEDSPHKDPPTVTPFRLSIEGVGELISPDLPNH